MYFSICEYLQHKYQLRFSEADIFLFYGGITFEFKAFNDSLIPQFEFDGAHSNTDFVEVVSGLTAVKHYEKTGDEALQTTFNLLKNNEKQLVYVNCFYLPFDELNYRQNQDLHFLVISKFNKTTKEFTVHDQNGTHAISLDDLIKARENIESPYFESNVITLTNDVRLSSYSDNKKYFIIENAQKMNTIFDEQQLKFHEFMESLEAVPVFFKYPAAEGVSRNIKHPRGFILSRLYMSQLLQEINEIGLSERYIQLSKMWNKLANDLLRYGLEKKEFEDIRKQYLIISELEKTLNKQVIQLEGGL